MTVLIEFVACLHCQNGNSGQTAARKDHERCFVVASRSGLVKGYNVKVGNTCKKNTARTTLYLCSELFCVMDCSDIVVRMYCRVLWIAACELSCVSDAFVHGKFLVSRKIGSLISGGHSTEILWVLTVHASLFVRVLCQ